MMNKSLAVVLVLVFGLAGVSCVTTANKEIVYHVVTCLVESEMEGVFEVHLDDDLILSGKASTEKPVSIEFMAPVGRHSLSVTSEGHDPWRRDIKILAGPNEQQHFWVKLQKYRVHVPTSAR
jgi:hypothetical protein